MRGIRKIIQTAQQGGLDAQSTYSRWSNGMGISYSGVEAFVSVKIAEKIHLELNDTKKLFVTLEYPVQALINNAEKKFRGRKPRRLSANGRVDVTVWDKDDYPRVIIEVKRHLKWQSLEDDIDRISLFMKRYGTQNEGSLAAGLMIVPFVTWQKLGREKIHTHEQTILEIAENAGKYGFTREREIYQDIQDDDPFKNLRDEDGDPTYVHHQYGCMCLTLLPNAC
ncbi:hypothetical protein [Methylobacterium sp. Leaf117]|uniref:hypothetical protein n=1 Tax=Methylobacterium sp. Leaf117 TaxID=1736260 RepID=UPI000A61EFC1|nr:hypothetical protein [Methylobacterium sp. Leaf117]